MAARNGVRGVRRNRRPARAFQLNSACAIMPSQAEARSPSSSSVSSASSGAAARSAAALPPKPQAKATVAAVAAPYRRPAISSDRPCSGWPMTHAGARSSASPNTPPKPVGSGQEPMRGNVETKPATRNVARIHNRPRHLSPSGRCANSRQPSWISGASSMIGGEAEQLHRQIGEDRAGEAEQVAHRRLRRVAERGILHRPGGERDGGEERQRDQRQSGDFAQAPPQDVAEVLGDESNGVEAAVDRGHLSHLTRGPRRGDAAPPPWSPCPAPWRRGYSPRRDCCRRPARARDSGRARRARRPPATAAW